MNKSLLTILGVVVVAAIISGTLFRNLRNERQVNEQLRSQLADAKTVPRLPAPAAEATVPAPAQAILPAAQPPEKSAPASGGMTPMEQDAMRMQISASSSVLNAALLVSTAGISEQDLLKNPEYRKAEVLQLRMRLAQSNPGLAEALGISEREAAQLFDAMAEDQLKRTTEMTARREAGEAAASITNSMLSRSPAEDPARIALGEEKYAKYQDYQRNVRPALIQVAGIGSMLTAAGQPLNESQARSLASSMLAEQRRQREAALTASTARPSGPRGIVDMLEEQASQVDAGNQRILDAASAVLNPAQLDAMRTRFDRESATRRQTLESTRQREASRPLLTQPATGSPR